MPQLCTIVLEIAMAASRLIRPTLLKRFCHRFQAGFCMSVILAAACGATDCAAASPLPTLHEARHRCGHARPTGVLTDAARESRTDSLHGWDALRYEYDLQILPASNSISGHMRMQFRADETLDSLELHLQSLNWGNVSIGETALVGQRTGDRLMIALGNAAPAPGDSAWLELDWWGTPPIQDGLGMYITAGQVYTSSDPWGTRHWLPCYDEPFDKALWSQTVRVPSNFEVLANGSLGGTTDHGDGTHSFHYDHAHPVATYLLSVVAYPYAVIETQHGDLPLTWMVYPQHTDEAATLFARVPVMLDLYERLWGDYPFESYAMGEAPIYGGQGGMEHQTCTTIGNQLVAAGGTVYESIVAHELAHQWWGDALTPVHFREAWLNEGWATYAEALFAQEAAGGDTSAFQDYFETQIRQYYLNWDSAYDPIIDVEAQDFGDFFTPNQYEKAACVIHMLRHRIGGTAFDAAQRLWYDRHRYGVVDSEDYRLVMEETSGQDLGMFFRQWLHTGGYPSWQVAAETVASGDSTRFVLGIAQTHPRMADAVSHIPIRFTTNDAIRDTVVVVEGNGAQVALSLAGLEGAVEFNRGLVALGRTTWVDAPDTASISITDWNLDDSDGGNGDGNLALGESALLGLTLRNTGRSLWNLELSLDGLPAGMSMDGSFPAIAMLALGQTVSVSGVNIHNQGLVGPAWVDAVLHAEDEQGEPFSMPLRLRVGMPAILLADGSQTGVGTAWWSPALDGLDAFHDTLPLDELTAAHGSQYQNLIVVTGEEGRMLDAGLEEVLAAFQGNGRWIWISGQDALDAPGPAGVADWLGLMVDNGDVAANNSTGLTGGPLDGVTALLIGTAGANNQTAPDALSAVDDIWQPVMQWPNGQHSAFAAPGLLVLGFGLEATSGMGATTPRSVFMDRCLGLLDPAWTAVDDGDTHPVPPRETALGPLAAAPNPFNPQTRLTFHLAHPGPTRLVIHDIRGAVVAKLFGQDLEAGSHTLLFDGTALPSGVYFARLESGGQVQVRKLLLIK